MGKEEGLGVDGIFEIVWEEVKGKSVGYSRDSLHPVKVKLVPVEGKNWEDVLEFYKKHNLVSEYTERKIRRGVKDGRMRNVGGVILENSLHDVFLDKLEGVFYKVHVGGHYITQHWKDILPEEYVELVGEMSTEFNKKIPRLKFETLEHGVLYVPLNIIVNYFVWGWGGEMNHDRIGGVFNEILISLKDKKR